MAGNYADNHSPSEKPEKVVCRNCPSWALYLLLFPVKQGHGVVLWQSYDNFGLPVPEGSLLNKSKNRFGRARRKC
jgi:hypothetical protein